MAGIDGVKYLDNKEARTQNGRENLWQVVRDKFEEYRKAHKESQDKFFKPDAGGINKTLDTKLSEIFSAPETKDAIDITNNAVNEIKMAISALWDKGLASKYIASVSNGPIQDSSWDVPVGLVKNEGNDISVQAAAGKMKDYYKQLDQVNKL